jgi:hypothetical protein
MLLIISYGRLLLVDIEYNLAIWLYYFLIFIIFYYVYNYLILLIFDWLLVTSYFLFNVVVGQVSLPRINRIGVSMFWESSFWHVSEHWSSEKLFIFFKYFTNFLFCRRVTDYYLHWRLSDSQLTFTVSKWSNNYIPAKKGFKKLILNTYLFWQNNRVVVLIIYSGL